MASTAVKAGAQTANTSAAVGPTVPSNLRVTSLRSTSVTFPWDPSRGEGIISYAVYQDGVFQGFTYLGSPVGYAGNLAPGSTHTFTVQAVSQNGVASAQSASLVATTPKA